MRSIEHQTTAYQKTLNQLREVSGDQRVAVGLSGGVDSSLTAALLVEAGWTVEGLTLWLMSGKGSCCSDGLVDAAGICKQLGIPHHVVDKRETFKEEVIESVINGYQQGRTPLPCSKCNRSVKFSSMLNWAKEELGVNRIATGHYARIIDKNDKQDSIITPGDSYGKYKLLRGKDKNKDQSYFLYDLSQEVLAKVIFPLGELTKNDTRHEAAKYELRTAEKPESQDLCLAEHHGSMKAFLDAYLPPRKGNIMLMDGTILGEHDGIEHFTIGQRKGLGVSWKEALHVVKIEPTKNEIYVAPRSEAGNSSCVIGEVNWVSIDPPKKDISVEVQIRYRSNPIKAKLIPIEPTQKDLDSKRPYRCRLEFMESQFSITPGQAAVFYLEDIVLGGGLIERF